MEPRGGGRPAGGGVDDQHAGGLADAELARGRCGERVCRDAERGMLNRDALLERGQQAHGAVDRNREADADVAFDRALDRVIDADQLTLAVEQRATRVSGVDRRIRLDHPGECTAVGCGTGAVQAGYDAGGERALQPEGRADGERGVTHLEGVGIAGRYWPNAGPGRDRDY